LLKVALYNVVVSNNKIKLKYKLNIYNVKKILNNKVINKTIKYLIK